MFKFNIIEKTYFPKSVEIKYNKFLKIKNVF